MTTEPIWLSVMRSWVGLREISGPGSNPVITQWAHDLGVSSIYTDDDLAWCALAMNRLCLACQLPLSGSGYALLRAVSFETWGQPSAVALGAVMVFHRPGGYHVGPYLGERADAYYVLGGNTGNAVAAAWIKKDRLTAIRWPTGYDRPAPAPVLLAGNGQPLSENEV